MKQNTRKLFSLLLALVMVFSLAVPALAAENEPPEKELHWVHLDQDENGKFFAGDDALKADNPGEGSSTGYNPQRSDMVMFFIWNNTTNKREGYVAPKAGDGLTLEKMSKEAIASNAKQAQYYFTLRMTKFQDSELTADGLSFRVFAMLDDFTFYSAETPSIDTLLGFDAAASDLTDDTLYFISTYAGTDEAEHHAVVTKVEKDPGTPDYNKLYDIESVKDGQWKVTINDTGKRALKNSGILINLKLEVKDPDGNTHEDGRSFYVQGEPQGNQLFLIHVQGEWTEESGDIFYFDENMSGVESQKTEIHAGEDHTRIAFFATLADGEQPWTEDGKPNMKAFTPVDVKSLKASDGLTVESVSNQARKGDKFAKYFVRVSVAENGKEYKLSSGDYSITVDSGLPRVGVYSAPTASFDTWLGEWGFKFHPVNADQPYYIISTSTDDEDNQHLVDAKFSTKDLPEFAGNSLMDLEKVSDDVYKLSFKKNATLTPKSFQVVLDLDWEDFMGHTWTEVWNFGNFDPCVVVLASDSSLVAPDEVLPFADAAGKVTTSVTMDAAEQKSLYLYAGTVGTMEAAAFGLRAPRRFDGVTNFHTSDPALTLTVDEADHAKYTLSASKAGTYEIYYGGYDWDYPNMKLYHADGTEYTEAEWKEFDETTRCYFQDDGTMYIMPTGDDTAEYVPFEEMFPGEKYEVKSLGLNDYGFQRLTVTVTGEGKPQDTTSKKADPTNNSLTVDGASVAPTAYKIDGANYFKLRDLAALLNGTGKQFNVGYDDATHTATITAGQGYTKQSTDLQPAPAGTQKATPTNDSVQLNGKAVQLTVYKVNGSNYFKLRDLGQALDFYVGYDDATKSASIDTTKGYDTNS